MEHNDYAVVLVETAPGAGSEGVVVPSICYHLDDTSRRAVFDTYVAAAAHRRRYEDEWPGAVYEVWQIFRIADDHGVDA